jgi:hypothetical protein
MMRWDVVGYDMICVIGNRGGLTIIHYILYFIFYIGFNSHLWAQVAGSILTAITDIKQPF